MFLDTLYPGTMRTAALFGLFKGGTLSVVMAGLDVTFWKQVVIILIGSTITSIGVIVAAVIAARAAERNRQETVLNRREIEHVKTALGVDRRADDNEAVERARDNEGTDGTRN